MTLSTVSDPPCRTSVETTARTAIAAQHEVQRFYCPELDALRFVAFLLVFISHVAGAHAAGFSARLRGGGAFGVSVFFALSAYLITALLRREKEATGHIDIRSFYVRRMLRIWPLYFLALALCAAASRMPGGAVPLTIGQLLPYLLLVGNWPATHNLLLPLGFSVLWSIGVEEQFYLLWPAVMRFKPRVQIWVLVSLWVMSQLFVAQKSLARAPYYEVWFNTFAQMQYFAIGAAVSLLARGNAFSLRWKERTLMIGSGIAVFLSFPHSEELASYLPFLAAGGGAALLLAGFVGFGAAGRNRCIRHLGKISYGLYVFHFSVIVALRALIGNHLKPFTRPALFSLALPLTVLIAHTSYSLYEARFLRLKERFEVVKSRGV